MPSSHRAPLVVTTPTGNTGRYVLETVLREHETIRVLVRDPDRLDASVRARCEVVQGDLRDPSDLSRALDGAEGVFFCVPQSPDPDDVRAYYQSFAVPFASAVKATGVRRVVAISGGDGASSGQRGVGLALHETEQTLEATEVAARHIRCGYFLENLFWMIQPIARAGLFSLPVAGDVPIPFVAARDIGVAAGGLLLDRSWTGQEGIAAHGPERLSCDTAAQIASEVLGFPVRFQTVSGEAYKASIAPHGVSEALGQSLVEMFDAIAAGRDMGAPAPRRLDCPTTLAAWMGTGFGQAAARIRGEVTTR
ncbi:MAG: NAD(P)H-binding protein [Cytophagales bacterium]|nr:NAD(P)H-binding protein [Armatimonadota bacterium]